MIIAKEEFTLKVLGKKWLSDDTFELSCTRPGDFVFKPGQYVTFCLGQVQREYTIISSVHDERLSFLVKVVPGGEVSNYLAGIRPGDEIDISKPRGYLTKRTSGRPSVFVATGTGIAPFVSMAGSGVTTDYLLHGAAYRNGLFYSDKLQQCSGNYIPCLSRGDGPRDKSSQVYHGYVTAFLEHILPPGEYDFYLCGKWDMIREATHVIDKRFPRATINSEGFY